MQVRVHLLYIVKYVVDILECSLHRLPGDGATCLDSCAEARLLAELEQFSREFPMRQRLTAGYRHPTIFSIEQRIFGNLFEYLPSVFFFARHAAGIYGTRLNTGATGNADIAVGDYLARPVAV